MGKTWREISELQASRYGGWLGADVSIGHIAGIFEPTCNVRWIIALLALHHCELEEILTVLICLERDVWRSSYVSGFA